MIPKKHASPFSYLRVETRFSLHHATPLMFMRITMRECTWRWHILLNVECLNSMGLTSIHDNLDMTYACLCEGGVEMKDANPLCNWWLATYKGLCANIIDCWATETDREGLLKCLRLMQDAKIRIMTKLSSRPWTIVSSTSVVRVNKLWQLQRQSSDCCRCGDFSSPCLISNTILDQKIVV